MSEVLTKITPLRAASMNRPILKKKPAVVGWQRPTLASILTDSPEISNFFEIRQNMVYNCKGKIHEKDNQHLKAMRKSMQKAVLSLQDTCTLISQYEAKLKGQSFEIRSSMATIAKSSEASYIIKILLYLKYEENQKIIKLHYKHCDVHRTYIQNLLEIANIVQIEHPQAEFVIHSKRLANSLAKRPDSSYYEQHKKNLSFKIKDVSSNEKNTKIKDLLDIVFTSCEKHYNESFDFIEDDGLIDFQRAIDSTSSIYHGGLQETIKTIKNSPKESGAMIIKLCQIFIEVFHVSHPNALRYLFILFTRYVFGKVYTEFLHNKLLIYDKTFVLNIKKMRDLRPYDFPPSLKFLPNELHNIKISEFPEQHPYSHCVQEFIFLQFEPCPVDFCYSAYKVLNNIQRTAASLVFSSSGERKNEEECQLSLDDLLDITTIVAALASPFELKRILTQMNPYVCGLKLSSQLEFAFMSLMSVCNHIMAFFTEKI